jgi:hypothetical protein
MAQAVTVETVHPDGARQVFTMTERGGYPESATDILELHVFTASVRIAKDAHSVVFEEHEHAHGSTARDNNCARQQHARSRDSRYYRRYPVSALVIVGLDGFGWTRLRASSGLASSPVGPTV